MQDAASPPPARPSLRRSCRSFVIDDVEHEAPSCGTAFVASILSILVALVLVGNVVVTFLYDEDDKFPKIWSVLARSAYLTACLFVAELAVMALLVRSGPGGAVAHSRRVLISSLADLLLGPVSVISFYESGIFGTVLFFGTLWHFLLDHSHTRPTHILAVPWGRNLRNMIKESGLPASVHVVQWIMSCLWVQTPRVAMTGLATRTWCESKR